MESSSNGNTRSYFYDRVLDDDVVMLLPGGMTLYDRAAIVESMSGKPWNRYTLEDLRCSGPTPAVRLVTYGVVAERDGHEYSALMSSLYVRRVDGWKLVFHQQTPR